MEQTLLQLGVSGIVCIVLVWALTKSEGREKAKDLRIQYLENQLIENYDERIEAAERLSNALYENAKAMDGLTREVRNGK